MQSSESFSRRSKIEAPPEEVFRWHTRPGALERLTPPWERLRVLERTGGVENGAQVLLEMRAGPFRLKWLAEHHDVIEGREFRDVQLRGPFDRWVHKHRMSPAESRQTCYLEDEIEYELRFGRAGRFFGAAFARRQLERMFSYRHRVTSGDLAAHQRYRDRPRMNILITGSSGLVGSALVPFLTTGGHRATRLVRPGTKPGPDQIVWDPAAGRLDAASLEGFDAVVHLAGENIAGGRWTAERKRLLRDSRLKGTRLLAETLARLDRPPQVLVAASATGYYGDRGDEILTEASTPGSGFLPDLCREWEAAAEPASAKGVRLVNLRFGVVLTPAGGALAKMLPPFKAGVGGPVGSGRQYMSWIALDDAVGAVHHALMNDALRGPVNAVAPEPVTNREFTRTLGRVLGRQTFFAVPAFALRLLFGELADAALLASCRVLPSQLESSRYAFRHPELEDALRHVLGKPVRP